MAKLTMEIRNIELVNYLEGLSNEVQGRKEILAFLSLKGIGPGNATWDIYHKECMDYILEYSLARKELEDTYIIPTLGVGIWRLEFCTGIVTLEDNDEKV